MTSAISICNLNFKINNCDILKNINIDIKKGECVIITGHNGAGKTTLLKVINNLIKTKNGNVKIFDKDICNTVKKHIGYIPQINFVDKFIPISVQDVIKIGLTAKNGIFKRITPEDKDKINNIAKTLKIEHLLNKPIGQLSGGQIQKVSIARVLVQDAKIILMDEPLNNLDNYSQNEILNIIDSMHKEKTMVIVTHNLKLIPKSCNKIIVMENGKIIKTEERLNN